jgi:hypothetical protein
MKTVLTSIITSIITVVIALFIVHYTCGDKGCAIGQDDKEGCCEKEKTECCDNDQHKGDAHCMMMEQLIPFRAELEKQLTEEEKATIEAIEAKFEEAEGEGHEDLSPEGMTKFQEAHKDDVAALLAIANNHQQFFDDMTAKMHDKEKCEKVIEGEAAATKHACPEAAKCKEATEKCTGEQAKTEAGAKECKEAKAECKKTCEGEMNSFKVHFLLMDDDDDGEEDDD